LLPKRGRKSKISRHSVCGSFGYVILLDYFFVLATVVACILLSLYEIKLLVFYPLIIVWNKTAGFLFKVIWWSSGHHLLSHQFVMIALLWSKNDVVGVLRPTAHPGLPLKVF
jgi:hypothetical protein